MRVCPFCGHAEADDRRCPACGLDPTAPRLVCSTCKRMTPRGTKVCVHCRNAIGSELSWKIPLAVVLIIVALILGVVLQSIR